MQRQNHLFMVRPHLDDIPSSMLADGFTLRTYRPGDEAAWTTIIRETLDPAYDENALAERLVSDEEFLPERIFFACHGARPVGTAAGVRLPYHGDRSGYVYMLAVLPAYRRMGLGTALLATCLAYFKSQGWCNAVLDTERERLGAIRLYLRFGFEPFPETSHERAMWKEILSQLNLPIVGNLS